MPPPAERVPMRSPLGPAHIAAAPVIDAAGALVWRLHHGKLQVRLVHRPRYDDWSWPKGKLEAGETFQAAAVREVAEETGRPIVLGAPLPGLQYLTPEGRVKRVHYWAARRASDEDAAALAARAPVAPVSPDEIDDAVWLGLDAAEDRVTRVADQGPLRALGHEWKRGRLDTHVLVIARHGKAVGRAAWYGDETDRPLTPAGVAQAVALIPVLAGYGVRSILTSQWSRCAQTIAPYAHAAGLTTCSSSHLTEAQHEKSPEHVAQTVLDLLATGQPAALCTHRPVLPTVFDALREHSRRGVASRLPAKDPYLQPGELLVAHVATDPQRGPRIVGAEKVAPPMH